MKKQEPYSGSETLFVTFFLQLSFCFHILLESIHPCPMLLSCWRAVFVYYLARDLYCFSAALTLELSMRMVLQLTMIPLFGRVLPLAVCPECFNLCGSQGTQPCPARWCGQRWFHVAHGRASGAALGWCMSQAQLERWLQPLWMSVGVGFGLPPCHQALLSAQLAVPALMDAEGGPGALTWHAEIESEEGMDIWSSRAQADGVTFLSKYLPLIIHAFLKFRNLKRSAHITHTFR